MKPGNALAEDFRRVGVALIVAGLVGGFLQAHVPGIASIVAAILGAGLCSVGYWLHHKEYRS